MYRENCLNRFLMVASVSTIIPVKFLIIFLHTVYYGIIISSKQIIIEDFYFTLLKNCWQVANISKDLYLVLIRYFRANNMHNKPELKAFLLETNTLKASNSFNNRKRYFTLILPG